MKRLYVISLALMATLAFSAVLAATASAEEILLAQWLLNGVSAPSGTPYLWEGTILYSFGPEQHVLCSSHVEGIISGAESLEEMREQLNLAGEKAESLTLGSALLCEADATCEKSATDVELRATNLPWDFEAELVNGVYKTLLKNTGNGEGATYETNCLIFGLPVETVCKAPIGTEGGLVNVAGGVEFTEEAMKPFADCGGSKEVGEIVPLKGSLLSSSNGTVSVSSE